MTKSNMKNVANAVVATQETSNNNMVNVLESLISSLSAEQKQMFITHMVEADKDLAKTVSGLVTEGQVKNVKDSKTQPVRVKQPELDKQLVQKVLTTQTRLVKKEARRQLVSRVLSKLYQDRLFTTAELKETLAPVIESEWGDIDPVAEINNLLPEIGCEVVAKEARIGRGRLHNVWSVTAPKSEVKLEMN